MSGGGFEQLQRGTSDFLTAAFLGKIPGVRRVVFSGYNNDVDTATVPEDVFPALATGTIPRVTVAESWEIVSSSANDTAAGTGARTVTITTVDGSYNEVTQTVTLNGATAVALTGTHLAANASVVATAGSGGVNEGLLTIRVAGGGAARAYLSAGDGVLNQCKYTVPAGHTLEIYTAVVGLTTSAGTENARFVLLATDAPTGRQRNTVRLPLFAGGTSMFQLQVGGGQAPFGILPEKTESQVRVVAVSQNNTMVDAIALGLLYDSTLWP
jgi:hypothetical protein